MSGRVARRYRAARTRLNSGRELIHSDLARSVDGLLDWARVQPATAATRAKILLRLAALMAGPWGTFRLFFLCSVGDID